MITFAVNDMTCGHCAGTITKALKAIDEHAMVEIDLAAHRVRMQTTVVDAEQVAHAIRDAGYTPLPVASAA